MNELLVAKEKHTGDRPFDPLNDVSEIEDYIQLLRKAARLRVELREIEKQAAEDARARQIRTRDTRSESESTTRAVGLDTRPSDGKSSTTKEVTISGEIPMCSR